MELSEALFGSLLTLSLTISVKAMPHFIIPSGQGPVLLFYSLIFLLLLYSRKNIIEYIKYILSVLFYCISSFVFIIFLRPLLDHSRRPRLFGWEDITLGMDSYNICSYVSQSSLFMSCKYNFRSSSSISSLFFSSSSLFNSQKSILFIRSNVINRTADILSGSWSDIPGN